MELSKKIQAMELSPIRKFVPYADAARAAGKKVYGLNIGQPDIKTPRAFFDAVKNFDQDVLAYANSQGIPELLEALVVTTRDWVLILKRRICWLPPEVLKRFPC